ncbi:nucleotidyl transferase AbiEii/AbiGii toxin family protein [Pseudobacter ginsenosidimutans]|uniref:nucleotidyl transferase AbiEii/AbiGii toxin family protein n=1 Tax=Pseudobacter ginsenosidimutans TaxID=661488 RepID=UPI001A935B35|nr:nucleotidyl transferase AbiEii/AbiGii toxin family protein [Pseudobacter ginsenosidimutans]
MHWETVTALLKEVLEAVMKEKIFDQFRLVGGTSLSLQCGHRSSVDIELFTDAEYGSIDFESIDHWFRNHYAIVITHHVGSIGFGITYYIGHSKDDLLKVDLYYTDTFVRPIIEREGIRLADEEDVIAMKLNIVGQEGEKKTFGIFMK